MIFEEKSDIPGQCEFKLKKKKNYVELLKTAGKMAQCIKCVLCRCEDLSSNPQPLHEKTDMVANTSKTSTGEVETGGLCRLTGQDSLADLARSRFSERSCLKKLGGE